MCPDINEQNGFGSGSIIFTSMQADIAPSLYSRPAAQRRYQSHAHSKQLRILQSAVPGPKTRQSLEARYRLKFTKQVPGHTKVQDGNHGIDTGLPQKRRMGYLYRSHGRIPPCTDPYPLSKYLRFHHKGVTYQFVSLPFGLAIAPLVFTSLVKEVKLLALQQGIILHQYLDDWSIRAPSKEECHSQTQALLSLVKDLGFVVNLKKSELRPSQRFDFLGYHFLLDLALVKSTQDRWTKLQEMFHRLA